VCSPELHAGDARGWTKALGDRRVIVWDNYPVNDALMTASLHLGPYQGRDAELVEAVGGVLCNPMTQARASQIALGTAMDFLAGPDAYDAHASWSRVISEVGGERADALSTLARACSDSPIARPETLDLAVLVGALAAALDGDDWVGPVRELRSELDRARAVPDAFPDGAPENDPLDDPLAAEVGPWAGAARRAAEAGLAALRLIQASRPVARVEADGGGRAAPPDPEPAMHAAFLVLYVWKGVRAEERVVFGPRFAIYTPVVQMADGAPALDAAAALREDANAIDALCRLGLRAYDAWRTGAAGQSLTLEVDGEPRPIGADGTFEGRGDVVVVRQGSAGTRLDAGLPFSDRRLA
jgi:beta-N-acetylglucosaminidase